MPLTLNEIDILPRYIVALEDIGRRIPDHLRSEVPDFQLGEYLHPFHGRDSLICYALLAWWN